MTSPTPDIRAAFSVPFGFALRPDDGLNEELALLFLEREQLGERHANPQPYTHRNPVLFESNFDLFKDQDRRITALRDFCLEELTKLVVALNEYDASINRRLRIGMDAWFHVTHQGGFFGVHNHPMASWSGVYCITPGDEGQTADAGGELAFINPFIMNTMFIDAGNSNQYAPYSLVSRAFNLKAGELILFPSWVLHEVKPYVGRNPRITVAFNAWFHLEAESQKYRA